MNHSVKKPCSSILLQQRHRRDSNMQQVNIKKDKRGTFDFFSLYYCFCDFCTSCRSFWQERDLGSKYLHHGESASGLSWSISGEAFLNDYDFLGEVCAERDWWWLRVVINWVHPLPVTVDRQSIQFYEGGNTNLHFPVLQRGGCTQVIHSIYIYGYVCIYVYIYAYKHIFLSEVWMQRMVD